MISKVVILNDYGTITGGSTAVALASTVGLAKLGISVTLLTVVAPIADHLREVPGLEVIGLGQQEIRADPNRPRAFVRGLYNRPAVEAVRRVLGGLDPRETIVHVHTWTKAFSPFPIHTAINMGFKVVLTLHDFFITCPTGGFFVHRSGELCRRVPLSTNCILCRCDRRSYPQKLWRVARTTIQNRLLRIPERIAHFVGVSNLSVNVMRDFLPSRAEITVLRNPVDCQDLGPANVEDNVPFVYVGRFSKEKGVLLFAEAAGRLGVPAVFIGDGEVRTEAERLCPNGTFTGWLPPKEIARWLRRARALVFPPLWYETLGLVVVEAASHGVPAIIASKCAATDFIRHGETGRWFDHGSVDALCAQLTAMRVPGAVRQLGRKAYDWYWSDPWTTESHVDDLFRLYHKILGTSAEEVNLRTAAT